MSVAVRPAPVRRSARPVVDASAVVPARARWSREWWYFTLVVSAWCFMPLVRRLLDWHNGYYNPVQISSTIPFILTVPLAIVAFRPERIARLTPAFKIFAWVWLASFAYGLLVSVAVGELFGGIYEAIQYLVPMLAGIWLAGLDLDDALIMRRLLRIVFVIGTIVAAYGILQFVQPPPWDILWIEGGQFTSMGNPVPFGLRIFSTLNSTGPAADFFVFALLFALPFWRLKRIWMLPFTTLIGGALLLTLVREAWVAIVVGVAVYLAVSPRRFQVLPFLVLYGILLAFLVDALPLFLGAGQNSDVVSTRIATLADVGHDSSALARSSEIDESIQAGLAYPFGEGLGEIGAASMISGNKHAPFGNVLDSGYLARLLELGWLGFAGYLFVIFGSFGVMIVTMLRASVSSPKWTVPVTLPVAAAICAALMWADAAGDSHLAFDGLFFWIALGIGLRRVGPAARPSVSKSASLKWRRSVRFQ